MTRLATLIVLLVILVVGASVGYFNAQPVEFDYLLGTVQFPLIAVMIGAFSIGILLAVAVVSGRIVGMRMELGRVRKQLREAEGELRTLRNLPVGAIVVMPADARPLFAWLLLPLGIALGWALRTRRHGLAVHGQPVAAEQLGGWLTQLASDDPDQAISALTQVAEIDHSTVELHLTLGNLFRKRGEIDRALRVHEALLARTGLPADMAAQVRRELAQDYMRAGVMDHAEQQFEALVASGYYIAESLDQIRVIYEQGHDWKPAIRAARRVEAAQGESKRALIAQYHCELADEAKRAKNDDEAIRYVREAADEDLTASGAHLMLGTLLEAQNDPAGAAQAYLRAFKIDPRFLPEVIEPLYRCSQQTGSGAGYLQFLHDAREISPSSLPFVAEARLLMDEGVDPLAHLAEGLNIRPSRAVLAEFLEALEKQPNVVAVGLDKHAATLRQALRRLMEGAPRYQCGHCGFAPRQLFWQCPSCKRWGSTAPLDESVQASSH